MSNGRIAKVEFVEDEDIYIDCRPVSTYGGEVIIEDEDNNVIPTSGVSADMVDSIALNFSNGTIIDNIGFQTILGVVLLGILYGIGNYVFKEIPKNLIEKKLRQI